MKKLLFILLGLFSLSTKALVDYSPPPASFGKKQENFSQSSSVQSSQRQSGGNSSGNLLENQNASLTNYGHFHFRSQLNFLSYKEKGQQEETKSSQVYSSLTWSTPLAFYFQFVLPYNQEMDKHKDFSQGSKKGFGNSEVYLGLNWFNWSNPNQESHGIFDFFFGLSLPGKGDFASTRTDKIFGIITQKKFQKVLASLGGSLTLTGETNNSSTKEKSLGNISRLWAQLGLSLTDDISWKVKYHYVTIGKSSKANNESAGAGVTAETSSLQRDLYLGIVEIMLQLHYSSIFEMGLFASFHTKPAPEETKTLGLWNQAQLVDNLLGFYLGFGF